MGKNTGEGFRSGAVKNREQIYNSSTGTWTVKNTETGKFMRGGSTEKYKGITVNSTQKKSEKKEK